MLINELRGILLRELRTLRSELLAYENEQQIWAMPPGVTNSAGTLSLHLTGNLRHYLGSQFGGTGYVRDRDWEFEARDIPREELLADIDGAMAEVKTALDAMSESTLKTIYPLEVGGMKLQTGEFLLHLAVHLGYHLGQLDYHRRAVTGIGRNVRALNVRDLSTADSGGGD